MKAALTPAISGSGWFTDTCHQSRASCKLSTKRRSFEQWLVQGTLEGSPLGQLIVVSNNASQRSASARAGGLESGGQRCPQREVWYLVWLEREK